MWFFLTCCLVGVVAVTNSERLSTPGDNTKLIQTGEERISGGKPANITEFPYQVQVVVQYVRYYSGIIVSKNHILTGAHCVEGGNAPEIIVLAGSTLLHEGTRIPISRVVLHPDYDRSPNDLDIAVMKTKERIVYTDSIQPAILGGDGIPNEITVSGWGNHGKLYPSELVKRTIHLPDKMQPGVLASDGIPEDTAVSGGEERAEIGEPQSLRKVTLTVIDSSYCTMLYAGTIGITRNMFCAENEAYGRRGACKDDGGGPATYNYRVYGLSSFTKGCGYDMAPSVFTNLISEPVKKFVIEQTRVKYHNSSHSG